MVLAGSSKKSRHGVVVYAKRSIIHDQYSAVTRRFDIGLIQLDRPLIFSACIQPIALPEPNSRNAENLFAVVTGWGKTSCKVIADPYTYWINLSKQLLSKRTQIRRPMTYKS